MLNDETPQPATPPGPTATQAPPTPTIRPQIEIVKRIQILDVNPEADMFGFIRDVLIDTLDFEHAKPWLVDSATAAFWESTGGRHDAETVRTRATEYINFAVRKVTDHRSNSASRSVQKFEAWAWVLSLPRTDGLEGLLVDQMEGTPWLQYGAPRVRLFAQAVGAWEGKKWASDAEFVRMADGLACEAGCSSGCML